MSFFWQKVHSELECGFLRITAAERASHLSWQQSYEYTPRAEPAGASQPPWCERMGLTLKQIACHPHPWTETVSKHSPAYLSESLDTEKIDEDSEEDSDDESGTGERMSWQEFFRRLDAFEQKMKTLRRKQALGLV